MTVQPHHSIEQLEQQARRAKDATRHRRLRAVILAKQGWTAPHVADAVGSKRRTVQDWIRHYNEQGLDGLVDQRGGNHRYLADEQEQQIKAHLDRTAADPHDGVRFGADLQAWIEQQFGVLYSLNGIYALLDRLGYSWLMPRSRHPKADPQAQVAFKKKSPSKSKRWRPSIPTNASKCGLKMKPALASRAR